MNFLKAFRQSAFSARGFELYGQDRVEDEPSEGIDGEPEHEELSLQQLAYCRGWSVLEEDPSMVFGVGIEESHLRSIRMTGMPGCNLHGTLPRTTQLLYLKVLDLSNNYLKGTLPENLGDCPALTELYLRKNQLEGEIPESIAKCVNLCNIVLSDNKLEGRIPECIGLLQNLRTIWLSNNNLSGEVPSSLGGCKELKLINLSHNALTGDWPMSIGDNLADLQHCDASHNRLTGQIPNSMMRCTLLRTFHMQENLFEDVEATEKLLSEQVGNKCKMLL